MPTGPLAPSVQTLFADLLQEALEDGRAQGNKGWEEPIARSLAELGLPHDLGL